MGKSLAVFWNICLLLQSFWVKNEKFDIFKKNGFSGVTFIKLKCRCLQIDLPDFKTPNSCNSAYGRFSRIFKNIAFLEIVQDF